MLVASSLVLLSILLFRLFLCCLLFSLVVSLLIPSSFSSFCSTLCYFSEEDTHRLSPLGHGPILESPCLNIFEPNTIARFRMLMMNEKGEGTGTMPGRFLVGASHYSPSFLLFLFFVSQFPHCVPTQVCWAKASATEWKSSSGSSSWLTSWSLRQKLGSCLFSMF